MRSKRHQPGFTLLELIMVIVIMGIVGAMVAVFIRKPVDAYFDTARRAGLTDVADTALRRMARDIQKALPNSIRNPNPACIEFIPTRTGARYRAQDSVANNRLDFNVADSHFNMLGSNSALPADQQIRVNDRIVIYNLGIPGADAYLNQNWSSVTDVVDGSETAITINAFKFPLESPNYRFHVIPSDETIVSYVCSGGVLYRNLNYGYALAQQCPTATPASPGSRAILASNATACTFVYSSNVDLQRNGLVQMTIQLSNDAAESVNLYHEVHVNNTP